MALCTRLPAGNRPPKGRAPARSPSVPSRCKLGEGFTAVLVDEAEADRMAELTAPLELGPGLGGPPLLLVEHREKVARIHFVPRIVVKMRVRCRLSERRVSAVVIGDGIEVREKRAVVRSQALL